MSGVWGKSDEGRWRPLEATGFVSEVDLHDLIEQAPDMLPLAGRPTLAVVGREVVCGRERADLVAVEAETGRPVIIEIKLAANTDRRQALTQVLGYAAYIRRLDPEGLSAVMRDYLNKHEYTSIANAALAAAQAEPGFDEEVFEARLADSLTEGRLRAVIVVDSAPPDLVDLVGYLQEVTSDRLALDLVVVTAYEVAGQRILVPQLVEPDRSHTAATMVGRGKPSTPSDIVRGSEVFEESIKDVPEDRQPTLRKLLDWARELETAGLATLYTSKGKGRWVLNPRLPGQARAMVSLWNENGPYVSPYRTVLTQEAPGALAALDQEFPGGIGQGNYIKAQNLDDLLTLLRSAYVEAGGLEKRSQSGDLPG
ncbi:hypothetical protein EV644_102450 [Kribbella orskensis]|uniref:DUF91 domain-containing protein n=1 Tax=Kribbella orskensis TaxID=2512216 RepID=A0ABY2BS56_9ACTN|nr:MULTISPECIES: hypothetical protein [Kribbella]TCN42914.1 hypothetical protein EV642_102287 [Kribbella sp. VKM Ac-2500]TCO29730.1 hypothetical protein EV644_102450 [Kribbella orskensis]